MTATASDQQIVPHHLPSTLALRAADQGVADALESVLSENTKRVYGAQWRLFTDWCGDVGLHSLPAEPLTVARYLAARAGSGASIATIRLATSAIAKAHELAGHESPGRDPGVREALKGWGRQLAKPQRQAGALTADVLAVIRLTAVQPRQRGRGFETAGQAEERGRFDVALVAALSDAGLRRSEAAALTWGDVQRWDDGSGRITVIRSKTDVECCLGQLPPEPATTITGVAAPGRDLPYYRPQSFVDRQAPDQGWESVARGQLAVASEHLHFRGPGLSIRLAYGSVVHWEPYHDGIGAVPRAQPNRLVVFRNGDGWFIYNLTRNLAAPWTATMLCANRTLSRATGRIDP